MTNQPEFNPRKRDAIQHLKEQLKIKTLELRKALSEKGKLSKNIKNLISYSQGEIKKLKITIKAKDKKIEDQESIAWAARMSRHIGKISGAIKSPPPGRNEPDRILPARPDNLTEDINTLLKRTRLLRKKLEEERETSKKLQIQKEDLTLEINQLRQDSPDCGFYGLCEIRLKGLSTIPNLALKKPSPHNA